MHVDRGTLARIDRKLLAGLGQDAKFQMLRGPVTAAKWSTWKRYCDALGTSMGRAVMALIDRELVGVFGESTGEEVPLLAGRADEQLAAREAQVGAREREVKAAEERLRRWNEQLRLREDEFRTSKRQVEVGSKMLPWTRDPGAKVGRNERCPCGSGFKYKVCHGLTGR